MPTIRGFFFDLDGTLVDSRDADFQAYRDALADAGVVFTREAHTKTWGQDSRRFIPALAPHLTPEEVEAIRAKKSEYHGKYLYTTKLNMALVAFLKSMATAHQTVLVTTAKRKNGESLLKHHGLREYFTHVVFGDEVQKGKPDPESYQLALSKTGLSPNQAIAFEDSDSGAAAAEAAGISLVRIRQFT